MSKWGGCGTIVLTLILCCAFPSFDALQAEGGSRTLVLTEDKGSGSGGSSTSRTSHSLLFSFLQEKGHQLTHARVDAPDLSISSYGDFLYDNILILAPTIEDFGGNLDVAQLLEFVDSGGNLLLAASPAASDAVRELVTEFGLEMDEEAAFVQDHFNVDVQDEGSHTLIACENFVNSEAILGKEKIGPVLFQGTGFAIADENPLVVPVLKGSSSSYLYQLSEPIKERPVAIGHKTVLVAAMQARNNARVVVTGSESMLSDKYLGSKVSVSGREPQKAGNQKFMQELLKWTFKERGVLEAGQILHQGMGDAESRKGYRIKEEIESSIQIKEKVDGRWEPYVADDVQIEFTMLDPWIRRTMQMKAPGVYSTSFKVPDVYGVFQLRVEYRKMGYTTIDTTTEVPVRPFRHEEYERFIVQAYPYYASALSMLVASILLVAVLLFHEAPGAKTKKE